jgi:hypothetical protein
MSILVSSVAALGRHTPAAYRPPSTVVRLRNRLRSRGGDIGDAPEGVVLPDARAGREYACYQADTRTGWPVNSYLQPNKMRDLIPPYRRRQLRDPV